MSGKGNGAGTRFTDARQTSAEGRAKGLDIG